MKTARRSKIEFAAFYYNYAARKNFPAVINFKDYSMQADSGSRDHERALLPGIEARHWQTDTPTSNLSWGYMEHDQLKSADFLIHRLVDIVSKNGNLLLNIGPRPDGTIPDEVRATLLEIGAWLDKNGEAIYGTQPWKVSGEGPTQIQNRLWPRRGYKALHSVGFSIYRERSLCLRDQHGLPRRWNRINSFARDGPSGHGLSNLQLEPAGLLRQS